MLVSVAVRAQSTDEIRCKAVAEFFQSRLPYVPDEKIENMAINGTIAKEMFPEIAKSLTEQGTYRFSAAFSQCKPSAEFILGGIDRSPYKSRSGKVHGLNVSGSHIKPPSPARRFSRLPSIPQGLDKYSFSRADGEAVAYGTEFKDGESKRICMIVPGWYCTGSLNLYTSGYKAPFHTDKFDQPVFFPAAKNGKPLYENGWITTSSS
ncbi:hypothetical protein DFQ27_005022 [Actinomortierella ambigua]|uniref:Uncharacterized protein n=1 Tax=Actinomortierella ambigua TaxID=1343610 RepID=A0A9P6U3G7_9FUNG|nr:hypothetical protein DFQ27_005022 [Actinomortierella ambigua]